MLAFLQNTTINTKRLLNYYLGAMTFSYIYTIFTYSIAVFMMESFPSNSNSIFFVGVLLGIASFLGLFINGIWQYFQKVFSARTLMTISISGLLFSVIVFLGGRFIAEVFTIPAFLFLAVFSYMWVYDLSEITLTTLILKRSDVLKQGKEFAQKKIAQSIGMLMGILTGGLLSSFGSITSQFFLLLVLVIALLFFRTHFENEEDDVALSFTSSNTNWKDVMGVIAHPEKVQEKVKGAKEVLQAKVVTLSQNVSQKIQKEIELLPDTATETLSEVSHKTRSILNEARLLLLDLLAEENEIKREAVPKRNFHIREIFSEMGQSFAWVSKAFSFASRYALFLACIMVIFFSFWDTMAITYQPLFLQKFSGSLGFFSAFILPLFILPVFILQYPFALLSARLGHHVMMLIGLLVSGVSLVMLGTLDSLWGNSVWILILAGMGNTVGYAAAFSASQGKFIAELRYNAAASGLSLEDGAMASSLQLALNIGNIFGQLFGGMIFSIFGFYLGFLLIGVFLSSLFLLSLFFVRSLPVPQSE